jgi:RNA polymerase sigma factor (sigma-70 family)
VASFGSLPCYATNNRHLAVFVLTLPPHPNSIEPMCSPATQADGESLWVQKCCLGDVDALAQIREKWHVPLTNILLSRGASRTETDDLLADFWSDCVPGADDRPSLLEKFSGKCSLQGWLATVVTRRWIDLKRKQSRRGELLPPRPDSPDDEDTVVRMPAPASPEREDVLIELLRESLQAAFARCAADAMVLLRLIYLHGLSQRELAQILGRHESKVSRILSQAMEQIKNDVLEELKKRDPLLKLTWQDILDVCETQQIGFL